MIATTIMAWLPIALLQTVLDTRKHLTMWWLRAGYHTLTLLFAGFTGVFTFETFH